MSQVNVMTFVRAHYQRQTNDSVPTSSVNGVNTADLEDTISVRSDSNIQEDNIQFVEPGFKSQIFYFTNLPKNKKIKGLAIFLLSVILCSIILMSIIKLTISSNSNDRTIIVSTQNHCTGQNNKDICLTEECITVAASILSSMDQSVDPCHDFYEYACGGWKDSNPIPDGKSSWSNFEKLYENNQLIIKNILFANITAHSKAEEKVQDYFYSCMDSNGTIEALKGQPLSKLINEELGGWNMNNKTYNISKFNFQDKIHLLQIKYHFGGFFAWNVGENDKNSSQHIIQIDQSGLSLPNRNFYFGNDTSSKQVLKGLEIMMCHLFKLLIQEESEDPVTRLQEKRIKMLVKNIIALEIDLANITTPNNNKRVENQTLFTLEKMDVEFPFINWTLYFQNAFQKINRTISKDELVVVYSPTFFKNLTTLIKTRHSNTTGKNTLNNYLIWQSIRGMRSTLSKSYRDAGLVLQKAILGKESHEERWRFCVSDTDNVLGYALGAMFVRKAFNGNSKESAQIMISSIKEAFKKSLAETTWMDQETKIAAIDKADAISDIIGYPNYILEAKEINKKYVGFNVSKEKYFENNLRFSEYNYLENLKKLDSPVNASQWSMTPLTVNAYYAPTKNQIAFPAGLLQTPFFNGKYPNSLNFGAMGVVMGHELSHAFDDQGREFDKFGNKVVWWNNNSIYNFKHKTNCMEDQYSAYKLNTENINGKMTVGENIADNGGLKASFHAYNKWLTNEANNADINLPGINLTNQQLFFLSFSQVWCSSTTSQADHLQLMDDPHSPGRFRVIGPLSNFQEFAKAFKCPIDSVMNPKHKCKVW